MGLSQTLDVKRGNLKLLQSLVYPVRSCRDRVHFRVVILYSIHVERATQRHSRHHPARLFFTLRCEGVPFIAHVSLAFEFFFSNWIVKIEKQLFNTHVSWRFNVIRRKRNIRVSEYALLFKFFLNLLWKLKKVYTYFWLENLRKNCLLQLAVIQSSKIITSFSRNFSTPFTFWRIKWKSYIVSFRLSFLVTCNSNFCEMEFLIE